VPTIGGNISSNQGLMASGGYDQRPRDDTHAADNRLPLSERRDVLVFRTAPLEADMEVTGTVAVKLWVSSSAPDTDFTAKLIDEVPPNPDYPLGFDLNIGDSILRARYRDGLDHQAPPLKPDEVVPITITLYPTANVFKKGQPHPALTCPAAIIRGLTSPEYRRSAGRVPPHGPGRQHGLPRRSTPIAGRPARYSRIVLSRREEPWRIDDLHRIGLTKPFAVRWEMGLSEGALGMQNAALIPRPVQSPDPRYLCNDISGGGIAVPRLPI